MTPTLLLGWAVAASVAPPTPRTPAEQRATLFASGQVVRVDLTLDKKHVQALRDNPREHVPCTIRLDNGEPVTEVGVHLRGAVGSFQPVDAKPGLTLNVTKFKAGRTVRGMTKFHLLNCNQDPTYLQELLSGELFRAAGVPASRIAHAVVTLNGRSLGLYCLKEGYDKAFLREHFRSANGNLYDGGFVRDIDQPLERLSGPGDGDGDHADLKALVKACQEGDHAKRMERVEKLLDLDRFLALMAVDVFAASWDGYPAKANNYRVYHDPKANKITFIPSGMDQMFGDPNYSIFAFGGLVARTVIETKRGRELYLLKLRQVVTGIDPAAVRGRLKVLQDRVRPAMASVDKNAAREYPDRVKWLGEAIDRRIESTKDQLRRAEREQQRRR